MDEEVFVLRVGSSICLEVLTYGVYIRIRRYEKFVPFSKD